MRSAPPLPSIDSLGGVWQRSLLVTEDGLEDVTSLVWWLQLGAICGDIRAPAGGEAAETAFAGTLLQRGDVFTWRPDVAYGAVTDGTPDEGRLAFEGDVLREDGVHSAYLEHRRRIAPADPGDCAIGFRVECAAQPGILLMIGPYVFVARPRPGAEPTFLLARHGDGVARAVMALGGGVRPGDAVDLPAWHDGTLTFPSGSAGPAGRYPAHALSASREKAGRCA